MRSDERHMESTFTALVMLGLWDDPRPTVSELYARCTVWLERNGRATVPLDAFARLLAHITPTAKRAPVALMAA